MPSFIIKPIINNKNYSWALPIDESNITNYYYGASLFGTGKVRSLKDIFSAPSFPKLDNEVTGTVYGLKFKITIKNTYTDEIDEYNPKELTNTTSNNLNEIINYGWVTSNINKSGLYTIVYDCEYYWNSITKIGYAFTLTYNINIADNIEPLLKWNAWTVCERALAIAEPLRKGEEPRFILDTKQKDWLESIETPEFQFTRSNLREVLQGIGSYLHAEPRLTIKYINSVKKYVVTFDKYGGNTYSEFVKTYNYYASQQKSIAIENFATNLDSSVDNLVNSIDNSFLGSAIEPFIDGYKTVLAEGSYVRITDENMFIQTNYPIREIKKVVCSYNNKIAEITPYVFENAEYQQLSSYDDYYPKSKSYAIYYTIGQKGIQGLNFKRESILSEFNNYSIINILNSCGFDIKLTDNIDYQKLAFQIEYIPIYSARVQQNKSLISSGKKWTKPYNQSQNMIESKYYGENLKGVIARLGNVDKTITYVIPGYPSVEPKIGELYDNNYYIADDATEVYPFYTKITLMLSENFNKYNEHIGVNSVKRMYEISEQQAFDSEISYREFVVFSERFPNSVGLDNSNVMFNKDEWTHFLETSNSIRIGGAIVQGLDYLDDAEISQSKLILPVIASSFGNACLLTFKMEDNYSAGTYSYSKEIVENGQPIQASYTQTLPYSDIYGNLEYLKVDFINGITTNGTNWNLPPNNNDDWVESNSVVSTGDYPLLIKKGNSEIISFNYQLEFITTLQDLIIGSGLASNIRFIKQKPTSVQILLNEERLNKFGENDTTNSLEQTGEIEYIEQTSTTLDKTFISYKFKDFNVKIKNGKTYKSWGIYSVDGDKKTLLLGKNMPKPIKDGDNIFENLKFAVISERDLENLEEKEIKNDNYSKS